MAAVLDTSGTRVAVMASGISPSLPLTSPAAKRPRLTRKTPPGAIGTSWSNDVNSVARQRACGGLGQHLESHFRIAIGAHEISDHLPSLQEMAEPRGRGWLRV